MSWLFSQALVEAFLPAICSDGEPCAQLNVMPSAQPFWRNDKTMAFSRLSQFGPTSRLLTESHGEAVLTSYREAFPVRTSHWLALETGLMELGADFGFRWSESFAKYDPTTCSWRTRQHSLVGGLAEYSETWPRWGSMRSGESSVHAPKEPHIHERGCSWWPTPVATDHKRGKGSAAHRLANGRAVVDRPSRSRYGATLVDILGGMPNPSWVEWLMGWPINWTELEPLAMDRFRVWQQEHGEPLKAAS